MIPKTTTEWIRWLKWMTISSLVPVLIGVALAVRTYLFIQDAKPSMGIIKRFVEKKDDDGQMMYAPVFMFTDHSGRKHQVYSSLYRQAPNEKLGDKIKILYDPNSPNHAEEDHFFNLWGGAAIFFGFGTFGVVVFYFPIILINKVMREEEGSEAGADLLCEKDRQPADSDA